MKLGSSCRTPWSSLVSWRTPEGQDRPSGSWGIAEALGKEVTWPDRANANTNCAVPLGFEGGLAQADRAPAVGRRISASEGRTTEVAAGPPARATLTEKLRLNSRFILQLAQSRDAALER